MVTFEKNFRRFRGEGSHSPAHRGLLMTSRSTEFGKEQVR